MDFRGKNIDLVGKMWLWFGISLTIMLIGLVGWLWPKPGIGVGLNLGIDFKGGSQYTYRIPPAVRPQAGQEIGLLGKVNGQFAKQQTAGHAHANRGRARFDCQHFGDLVVRSDGATRRRRWRRC